MGTSHEDQCTFFYHLTLFFLEREMFHTKYLAKSRSVYETTWKSIVQPDGPKMTIWRTHFTCWLPKASNTHPEYVILIVFPLIQWLHESASMLPHTYIAPLFTEYIFMEIIL